VLGDRSGMSPELGWDLRASGLTHLLALSGLHVAWLAAAARMLAGLFGLGPRGRACAGAGSALLYIGLAGPLPSLVRAAVNEGLTAAGRGLSRALDPIQALATGTLALLCLAPMWATDVGFQLSCAASLGLVTIGPSLERALALGRLARVRLAHVLFRGTIPTIAAQTLALPLLLGRFHAIAWSGLFANLAAVPVCGLLLAAAWLGAGLEASLPGAGAPWFAACEALSSALRTIAVFAARAPSVLVPAGPDPALAWLAAFGAAALAYGVAAPRTLDAAAWPPTRARAACTWLGVFGLTLALGLTLLVPPLRPPNGRLWLVALDVGQGDAIALGTRHGWWLVDAGPRTPHFDAGQSVVAPFFLWAGVRRLEGLVLTHDHLDHTGGAAAVLRAMAVARRFAPAPLPTVAGPSRRFAATPCVRGDMLSRAPPILVRWPPSGARLQGDNAASLVLEVGEGNVRALLAADVDSTVEESLAVATRCALLKVAHHGAGSSSGARFLAGLGARLAVVSCGRRNRFGHPDAGALARLRAAGIDVHRTDGEGAVWVELSESGARSIEWRRGPPRSIEPQAAAESRPAQ
jgi:competence protein ComEC